MRYTILGKTGLRVSQVGFGGIPIRRLDRQEGATIVRAAVDRGVTFFDTAKGYGYSEEVIGEGLAGRRHEVVIATKTPSRTKKEAAADLEQSLRRLRTDHIDLYQLHNPKSAAQLAQVLGPDGALEALVEAKTAGKIGHIGLTNHSRDTALQALATGQFATLMLPFSFLEPEAAEKVLPYCQQHDIGFIAMKPFGGGSLNTPQQCLKWVLQQGTTVTIPGISSLAELAEDAAVADLDWTITADDLAVMERVKAELGKSYCRGCDYCQPCASDVNISNVLRSPLQMARMGPSAMANGRFEALAANADRCSECHECEPRCPYDLPIPELLRQRIAELRGQLRASGWAV